MHALKSTLFARASLGAIAVAAAVSATPAAAQIVAGNVFGGGATLPSATLRNLFDCYGTRPGSDQTDPQPSGCNSPNVNPLAAFEYASVGSGGGQRGWASQDPTKAATFNRPSFPDVDFAASDSFLSQRQLDIYNGVVPSSGTDDGVFSSTGPIRIARFNDNCVAPATGNGQDAPFPGTSTTYPQCYDNPRAENGPAIQIPLLGTGVVVAFDPIYRRERVGGQNFDYRFNYTPRATNDAGGLNLSIAQLCGIFSGQITNWNQVTSNGQPVLPGVDQFGNTDTVTSVPIQVVLRDDDSGTTNIFVVALKSLCGTAFAGDSFPTVSGGAVTDGLTTVFDGVTPTTQRYPGSTTTGISSGDTTCRALPYTAAPPIPPNVSAPKPSYFPGSVDVFQARGNEGVATCLNTADVNNQMTTTLNGRIGYLSTDFTVPYVDTQPFLGLKIVSANIQNPLSGNANNPNSYVQATPQSVALALEFTNTDPTNVLQNLLTVIPSNRDPNASTTDSNYNDNSYPISGASYFLLYTCYDSVAETRRFANDPNDAGNPNNDPIGFLNWYYASRDALTVRRNARSDVRRILDQGGFAAPPSNAREFILNNYVAAGTPTSIRTAPDAGVCDGDQVAN